MNTKNMLDELKLEKTDAYMAIKLEMNVKELSYMQKLLGCEIVYQVRTIIAAEAGLDDKTTKLFQIFDSFRMLDDQLTDFIWALNKYDAKSLGLKGTNVVVLGLGIAKIYAMLLKETAGMMLPEDLEILKHEHNESLKTKVLEAMKNPFDSREIKSNKKETIKAAEKGSAKVNIFSKKVLA